MSLAFDWTAFFGDLVCCCDDVESRLAAAAGFELEFRPEKDEVDVRPDSDADRVVDASFAAALRARDSRISSSSNSLTEPNSDKYATPAISETEI